MMLFLMIVALLLVAALWCFEGTIGKALQKKLNCGARVTGALFSMSASGTIGKAVTYGKWKGRPWARVWFIPENPQTAKQVNVRYAMTLMVGSWSVAVQGQKDEWDAYAVPFGMSGFNKYVSRGMDAYVLQLTTAVTPVSVLLAGTIPPGDVWTWA